MPLQKVHLSTESEDIESTRHALYVTASADEALVNQLAASDWDVEVYADVHHPQDCLRGKSFKVALMHLGSDLPSPGEMADWFDATGLHTKWIALVSNQGVSQSELQRLIRSGFYDFHTLPVHFERLLMTLGRAYGMAALEEIEIRPGVDEDTHEGIVGDCPAVRKLRKAISKIGRTNAPVLISGESGTGKELTAKAIHAVSNRRDAPFVPVNCGSIPHTLIQSELFGYEKGAFTGANKRQIGKIEAASGGTILLDEIGDLPLELQVNLLRFLEEQRIQRVGGVQEIRVDVRVVAATHVDLRRAVQEGLFREDLFYRLNVLPIEVPPLRARDDDIEILAECIFERFASEKQRHVKGFTRKALEAMRRYHWPGNVREMINRVRQALILSENKLITPEDLGIAEMQERDDNLTLDEARSAAEKNAVALAISRTCNNLSEAARVLGVNRGTLYRLIEKHKIGLTAKEGSEIRTIGRRYAQAR